MVLFGMAWANGYDFLFGFVFLGKEVFTQTVSFETDSLVRLSPSLLVNVMKQLTDTSRSGKYRQ